MTTDIPPTVARFFDPLAIEANRAGRLAPSQAARLRRTVILRVVGYLVSGSLAFMLYLARADATGPVGFAMGVVVLAALAVALLVFKVLPPLVDLRGGRVERIEGSGTKMTWTGTGSLSARYGLVLCDRRFEVSRGLYESLSADASVVLYCLPRTGQLLTLEARPA